MNFRIGGHFRRKAVAKDWHANGGTLSIVGDLEMYQASEYDITNVEVDLKGLVQNSGYHVHIVSICCWSFSVSEILINHDIHSSYRHQLKQLLNSRVRAHPSTIIGIPEMLIPKKLHHQPMVQLINMKWEI